MYYIYLLQSKKDPARHYTGYSSDLRGRLQDHNSGKSPHTSKYRPWELSNYFAFSNLIAAKKFEKYLKSGSGRAFIKKHLI